MYKIQKIYDELVEQYYLSLFRFCVGFCGNREDAEDTVQIAYMKLWNSKMDFESIEHAKNWLYKVAVNYMKDTMKLKWKNVELISEYADVSFENDEMSELFEIVQSLEKEYRIVILLYYYEGYSVKEIGKILGAKESTISTRLQRARQKLRFKLEEEYGE
ncbi:MAG: RNA polymerase sigma factor [Lachnospiraceae bacterium]